MASWLSAATLAGCSSPTTEPAGTPGTASDAPALAAATIVATQAISSLNFTEFVDCANGGAGEFVTVTGRLHETFHVTLLADGKGILKLHFQPQGVSGEGETSGARYQGVGVTQEIVNVSLGFTNTFINNFRLIGQGPGNNLSIRQHRHLTVNPDGVVTSSHDRLEIACK